MSVLLFLEVIKQLKKVMLSKEQNLIVEVPTGKDLLGRVVDGLGNPIDGKGPLKNINIEELN